MPEPARFYALKGAPRCRACHGPMVLPGATHPACDPTMPKLRALSNRARVEADGSLVVRLEDGAEALTADDTDTLGGGEG